MRSAICCSHFQDHAVKTGSQASSVVGVLLHNTAIQAGAFLSAERKFDRGRRKVILHVVQLVPLTTNIVFKVFKGVRRFTVLDEAIHILGIRVIGEVTKEKLDILREADYIFRDEIAKAGLQNTMSQYFAALTNMRSVGVMGDGRTYDYALALRSVSTSDFMTADWVRIPYEVLDKVSVRIVNEVRGINRILYDVTSKPPATIEFE